MTNGERQTATTPAELRVERWLVAAVLGCFAVVYAVFVARTTFRHDDVLVGTLFDDALISLRYAQNLLNGHGLVWNPGEQPPVEGYTNLGWLLLISLAASVLPREAAPLGVSATAGVLLLAAGAMAWSLLRVVGAGRRHRLAGMLLVLACYPTVFWSLRGMEVGLIALLLLLAVRLAIASATRRPAAVLLLLSASSGLGFLARNDAVLLFAPVLGWAVRQRSPRSAVRWMCVATPLALAMLGQFAFRYAYYGALVPNTYVLKMTGVSLAVRLGAGIVAVSDTLAPIAAAFIIAAFGARSPRTPPRVRELTAITLAVLVAQWSYLVYIGGDAWVIDYSNRFVATVMPLLLVAAIAALPGALAWVARDRQATALFVGANLLMLIAIGLDHPHSVGRDSHWTIGGGWLLLVAAVAPFLRGHHRAFPTHRQVTAAAAAALFLLSSAHGWIGWTRWNANKVADDVAFARLGLMLRDVLPEDATIAAAWQGAPAYFSERTAFDLLGKTDPHVARAPASGRFRPGHNKVDLAHSLGRLRPDVVHVAPDDISRFGYLRLANGLWVRDDSPAVRLGKLAESWCPEGARSVYCPRVSIVSR